VEHEERADELMKEADQAGRASDELKDEIDHARSDWESKKGDPQVPGAVDEELGLEQDDAGEPDGHDEHGA
jgi:hypothetical protein